MGIRNILRKALSAPFILLIKFYQVCISPLKPPTCRFTPTCSQYGLEAFRRHGLFKGFYLTARRILRCHPWGSSGYDPVPEEFVFPPLFSPRHSSSKTKSRRDRTRGAKFP